MRSHPFIWPHIADRRRVIDKSCPFPHLFHRIEHVLGRRSVGPVLVACPEPFSYPVVARQVRLQNRLSPRVKIVLYHALLKAGDAMFEVRVGAVCLEIVIGDLHPNRVREMHGRTLGSKCNDEEEGDGGVSYRIADFVFHKQSSTTRLCIKWASLSLTA